MKRTLGTVVALGAIVALVVSVTASGKQPAPSRHGGNQGHHGKAITVIEHATSDTTTDTGADRRQRRRRPHLRQRRLRRHQRPEGRHRPGLLPARHRRHLVRVHWTTFLPGGQIVVAGPFYDAKDSTLAITGGTGRYRNARGTMDLHARAGGTEFAFVFHLRAETRPCARAPTTGSSVHPRLMHAAAARRQLTHARRPPPARTPTTAPSRRSSATRRTGPRGSRRSDRPARHAATRSPPSPRLGRSRA